MGGWLVCVMVSKITGIQSWKSINEEFFFFFSKLQMLEGFCLNSRIQCTTVAHPFYSFLLHFYYIKKKTRKSFAINLSPSLYVHWHMCIFAITICFDWGLFSFKFVSLLSCSYCVYLLSFLMQLMLMRVQPWNQRSLKRQLILRKLSEWIIFLHPCNER